MPTVRFRGREPVVHSTAFIAPNAWLIGDVRVGVDSSVWFNAVLRGENASIIVGDESNIQDLVVIRPDSMSAVLGKRVTIAHSCVLEGVIIEDEVLISPGSIILEGARIGRGSVVAAGSMIPARMEVPPGSYVAGRPAEIVGRVRASHVKLIHEGWRMYVELKDEYLASASRLGGT